MRRYKEHCTCQTNPYGVYGCMTHNLFSASSRHLASVHPEPPPAKNEPKKAEERAGPQKPCGCGAMFALKALVEATDARWSAERGRDGAFLDALGRAQALTGLPPFDWDEEPER